MENNSIKLIEGIFETNDAAKMLFPLVNSKINYHNLELFSAEIRSGGTIEKSKNRISYLKKSVEDLHILIKEAAKNDCDFQINCDINITIIPKKIKDHAVKE